ncbi:MAG: hypothetical protein D6754_09355 [Alphaproteobacteria bacterium]|nr:MAG: hypothetical protein D6754_09355 [Alphaproteobacteria bacterium]
MGDALFEDVSGDGAVDLLINEIDGFTHAIADRLFINDGSGNFTEADTLSLPGFIFGTDPGLI